MTTKEKSLGRSGLIIIGSIIGIMFVVGVISYISSKVTNGKNSNMQQPAGSSVPEENAIAPDFTLRTIDNKTVKLSDYRGKVVFLNFWATWCPPCRMELPAMEKLYEKLKDQPFVMLAVNVDEADPDGVRNFVRSMNLTFPVLLDDGNVSKLYNINAIPTTFIIKKNGVIDAIVNGARPWDDPNYINAFDKLIAEPSK
ncbi:MAG: peroxiredoxin family protein [bacterium]